MAAINHSILSYLKKNGFSKTFKSFLKEVQIEESNLKTSLDLEDVYSRYCEISRDANKHSKTHKEQGVTVENDTADSSEEAINKKKKKDKKKKGLEKNDGNNEGESEEASKSKAKKEKHKSKSVSVVEDDQKARKDNSAIDIPDKDCTTEETINKKKKKDKRGLENDDGKSKGESEETSKSKDKKEKHKSKSVSAVEDDQKAGKDNGAIDIPEEDSMVETKKRKKKKEVEVSKKASDKGEEMVDQGKSIDASEDIAKKKLKKRKLAATDESENKNVEKSETGESKRRKTEGSEETKVDVLQGGLNEQPIDHIYQEKSLKFSNKEVEGSMNGDLKDNVHKSSGIESARKQQNISAERKSAANTFQRVKADGVNFADEKLQDNSYWAKSGAENGYGAKAQEILGQVKGRDFRHEKTKKKRGSYRGGQIDMGSHSVKFHYDDDE